MRTRRQPQAGFSLIELCIVIAIVGVLASLAVPNYLKFVAKARQSEAKTQLANIYASEMNFMSDWKWYTMCLAQTGYRPEPNTYYLSGFWNGTSTFVKETKYNDTTDCSFVTDTSSIPHHNDSTYDAVKSINPSASPPASILSASFETYDSPPSFTAITWGSISAGTTMDIWTIDQNKTLKNLQSGI